jgi:Leucine-rich repeat (LRR) protein
MCLICTKEYNVNTKVIHCCENIKKIPKTLIKLKELYCQISQIKKIPKTLINLESLYCHETQIKKIPKTLINLEYLYCHETQIEKIPKSLINLKLLYCYETQIKFIPETIKHLKILYCNKYVLVSPHTYILQINNKKYLTFTRCQKNYKNKLRLKNLKFAYDPKYIIGHNTKKQLAKLFQN